MRVRGQVGQVWSAAPAPEPPWDLSNALSGSANTRNRDSRCSCSILEDASCCHPDFSCSWSFGGRKPGGQSPPARGFKTTHAFQSVCRICCQLHTLPAWISFQLSNDSGSHLRMTSVDHGQTICPARLFFYTERRKSVVTNSVRTT